jgi:hypothetical protein
MKKLILLLVLLNTASLAQVVPALYYTMDLANPLAPTNGAGNLSGTNNTIVNGLVGKGLQTTAASGTVGGGTITLTNQVTISFLFKPDYYFSTVRDPQMLTFGSTNIYFNWPDLYVRTSSTSGSSTNHDLVISLRGVGPQSYNYYLQKYTLFTVTYNSTTGEKALYIDGLLSAGFSTTVPNTGTITTPSSKLSFNAAGVAYQKSIGIYDEIAIYTTVLTQAQVYQQYLDVKNGVHYTGLSAASVPVATAVSAPTFQKDYNLGYVLGSANAAGSTQSPRTQLRNYPLSRFKPGHTISRNVPWADLKYFSEWYQSGVASDAAAVDSSKKTQVELYTNWNYYLMVSDHVQNRRNDYRDTINKFAGAWVALANSNPTWKITGTTYWDQMVPSLAGFASGSPYIDRLDLPNAYYLRNASGQFLTQNGAVTTTAKWISPATPYDSIKQDGLPLNRWLDSLDRYLNRPLNLLSENIEVQPDWNVNVIQQDPSVVTDYNNSGISTWDDYEGNRRARLYTQGYLNWWKNHPVLTGTSIMLYNQDAWDGSIPSMQNFNSPWRQMRVVQGNFNGKKYSTMDLYVQRPHNFRTWVAADRGWQPYIECKNVELINGDSLSAPYVSAGWNKDEERNIRPAQWLGFLKLTSSLGAEFYNSAYFNLTSTGYSTANPPNSPRGYTYQYAMPVYAQAVTSRWENIFRTGSFLTGDVPMVITAPTNGKGYTFYSGSKEVLTTVRQNQYNTDEYVITTSIQPMSNMIGQNDTIRDIKIVLAGDTLQFKSRRQGAVYFYNRSKKLFYQLDDWHESTHPDYWSKNLAYQAEVADYGTPILKTYGVTGNDYRAANTVISYSDTVTVFDSVKYAVSPRNTANHWLWIKARVRTFGANAKIVFRINSAVDTIAGVNDTVWYWYRLNNGTATKFKYLLNGNVENTFSVISKSNKIEIDQFLFTPDSTLTLPEATVICSLVTNVTAGGPTTFCAGGSVVLSTGLVNNGSYTWSNGATTPSITVTTSGSYSVSVYDANGCSGSSSATTVTVNSKPTAPRVNYVSGKRCYGDSIRVECSAASPTSILWSTLQTVDSIYVKTPGFYNVTISNVNGCTTKSADTLILFQDGPPQSFISSVGSTSVCYDSIVKLVATPDFDFYAWFRDSSIVLGIDDTFNVTSQGTYSVYVVDSIGCLGISEDSVFVRFYNCDTCETAKNIFAGGIGRFRASINWSLNTDAENFVVYLTNLTTNTTITSTVEGIARKTIFTGLKPSTNYQYWIMSKCRNGQTLISNKKTFKTLR